MTTMLEAVRSRLVRDSVVEPLYAGNDHVVARIGPCLVILARAYPDEGIEHEAPRWVDALLAANDQPGGLFVVLQAGAAPNGLERLEGAYRHYARGVSVGALVVEDEGTRNPFLHARLNLRAAFANYPYQVQPFRYVGEGAVFLASHLPGCPPDFAPALAAAVEALRAAYARVPPDETA